MAKKFYVTTAIDYVNAKPHIGHAFEKTLADAIARYQRLNGKDVFFLTGVDENAQKNVEAAEKAGISVREFINKNTGFFIELCKKLNLSHDDFIRTTAKEHALVVQKIVKKIIDRGDIYKGTYEGLYCTGCEAYYTEKDLVHGKCPEHDKELELRKEDAYFFKLSKYKKELLKLIPDYVVPESKKNEILARVKEELNDVCISRKGAKWGIDFPDDSNYKIWVWVDALINYISGLKKKESKYWPADCHVIGKGINWFHSVIWPAILLSAGYKLPKTLLVHGYLNLGGQKMSKSLGNVIDPLELIDKYGADPVRYSLLKCSVFDDSDFSEEILISRNNNELADKLGNLISRVASLIEKNGLQKTENKLLKKLKLKEIEEKFENYELDKVLNLIFEFIDECNLYVQKNALWKSGDKKKLFELADSIKAIAVLLYPFIPGTCEKISEQFGFKTDYSEIKKPLKISKIKKGEILFKKIEQLSLGNKVGKETHYINNKINKPGKIEGIMAQGDIKFSDVRNAHKNRISEHPENQKVDIDFPCFEKLDLRVAQIKKIEDIDGADKLYKLTINVGELGERVICAGIKKFYTKDKLKNKKIVIVANLEPRNLKGIESKGMLLAAGSGSNDKCVLLGVDSDIENGARIS